MRDAPLLQVDAIDVFYGDFQALFGVSLTVERGQVVAGIVATGAGKSTLLRAIAGLMQPRRGGSHFNGAAIDNAPAFAVVKRGIALVPSERRHLPATALSGGQQQMCAIGRALMSNPDLLLCDEISLGLAPIIVRDIYAQLPAIVGDGMSLVIVEQDIAQALKAAAQVYCLQEGRIALQGAAHDLTRDAISAAYFGV